MALADRYRISENNKRLGKGVSKTYFRVPDPKPRAALGSIQNNVTTEGAMKPKASSMKSLLSVQPTVPLIKLPLTVKTEEPVLPSPESSPEGMDIEQITEAFSEQLNIEDIDAIDSENPQLCSEYAKDIYRYLGELEKRYHVPPTYMKKQTINEKMRCILIDWLIQVHQRFQLLQETLYLTVSIIDRYLSVTKVEKSQLQLVGVTAMLIASKYEEMYAPEVRDFVFITDNTYTSEQIRALEKEMLKVLDYSLSNPLCLHFLRRNSRAGDATPEIHTMAKFLMELCLPNYAMLEFLPSQIAAAALYISTRLYGYTNWNASLQHYSRYAEEELLPCARKMATLICDMHTSKQQAVRTKYSANKFLKVAKEDLLKSSIVKDLAALDV